MQNVKKLLLFAFLIIFGSTLVLAQTEDVGGPYVLDANTVLLLHLDGDLSNASDSSADAVSNGNIMFLDNTELPALGKYVYLDNDARSDSSSLSVEDNPHLDMTGDWTVECWVNVLSFGAQASDWHGYPKLVSKKNNFWMGVNGLEGTRNFQTGYEKLLNGWADAATETNIAQTGIWYHVSSIRDNTNRLLMMLIHDKDKNLVAFKAVPLGDEESENPQTNDVPVEIGMVQGWGDTFLNGLVDEVRISNVVRQFPMPPVIKKVHQGPIYNAEANTNIEIDADLISPSGTITNAVLHYSTGSDFSELPMSLKEGVTYSATIPGQAEGTQIKYYITIENSHGYSANSQKSVMSDSGAYYGIAVGLENSIVLNLDFENTLYDSSVAHHEITTEVPPIYSDDAISGDYSLHMMGDSTSMITIDKPAAFLASTDITIDMWVNPDSVIPNTALIGKFSEWQRDDIHRDWRFGYRLWWNWWDGRLTSEFFIDGQEWTQVFIDSVMEAKKWYRIITKCSAENGAMMLELYDANNNLIQESMTTIPGGLVQRAGTFCIGGDLYDFMIPWRYKGKMDALRIYNYAAKMPPALKALSDPPVSHQTPNTAKVITADIENSIATNLYYSIDDGVEQEITMTLSGGMTYSAEIPGQDLGTVVKYYITAINDLGKTLRVPGVGTHVIGFNENNTLMLQLDFENGSGVPVDKSHYDNEVTVYGVPTFSSDAPEGNYSLYYEGDSSYIRVLPPAPFLISDEMTIDIKFKADGQLPADGTDLIAKYSDPPDSWRFGFRISFQADGKLFPEFFMVADTPGEPDWAWSSLFLANDTRITVDNWYRFVMEIGSDSAWVRLYDANDVLLDSNSIEVAGQHINPVAGMFCLGRSWWDPAPIFKGMFDDIKIYNYSITETPTKVESQENAEIPTTFALKQNYPNPFNPTTQIRFEMPSSQLVKLSVFNVLGQKVKTLVNKQLSAGKYSFEWDGTNESGNLVSSGVYFYRFETPAFTQVHKMMYIR